jgi:hypothetical protein
MVRPIQGQRIEGVALADRPPDHDTVFAAHAPIP